VRRHGWLLGCRYLGLGNHHMERVLEYRVGADGQRWHVTEGAKLHWSGGTLLEAIEAANQLVEYAHHQSRTARVVFDFTMPLMRPCTRP
jgi:hypothetical protein